ncbi:MAG: hypothetical protein N2Z23_01985 [Pyrinomonadaceae bacterium]|nr:hypothetical protein [Pyrinomonadaceae bacterium]MCX7639199.1 hypothetical protein [Pyrinomonadaceae bacterium]MDW8303579.1 hypothetical protein [Acidobacteriota bacterium]
MKEGEILTWTEVSQIHKTRNGIYQKNGRLVSLLTDFGRINSCYPDRFETDGVIIYTGAGRRGNQKLDCFNRALLDAIESAHRVPLFCKLRVGQWKFLGFWRVASSEYVFDESQNRMIWRFRLEKAS